MSVKKRKDDSVHRIPSRYQVWRPEKMYAVFALYLVQLTFFVHLIHDLLLNQERVELGMTLNAEHSLINMPDFILSPFAEREHSCFFWKSCNVFTVASR